jgi:hypothetical protein
MEKTEFEFPDETEDENPRKGGAVVEPEVEPETAEEIEVVDDTPAEDRNRKPMEEPPKDVTDEELAKYDESVQKRIKHFTKGYHEERRAKEAALREREETLKMAQTIVEENKKLKGSLSQGQNALLEQAKKNIAHEVEAARAKYKAAYESGDADALVDAQEELTLIHRDLQAGTAQDATARVSALPSARAATMRSSLPGWFCKASWAGLRSVLPEPSASVNSALTSDTRPAPLVTTKKFTIIKITKMIKPTR